MDALIKKEVDTIINKIENSIVFKNIQESIKKRGYTFSVETGIIKNGSQDDFYYHFAVLTPGGKVVETFDDGILTIYEPIAVKTRFRNWVIVKDAFSEIMKDFSLIMNYLHSTRYIICISDNQPPLKPQYYSLDGVDVVYILKKRKAKRQLAIIDAKQLLIHKRVIVGDIVHINNGYYELLSIYCDP